LVSIINPKNPSILDANTATTCLRYAPASTVIGLEQ